MNIPNQGITPQKQFPSWQGLFVINSDKYAPKNPIIKGERAKNEIIINHKGNLVRKCFLVFKIIPNIFYF